MSFRHRKGQRIIRSPEAGVSHDSASIAEIAQRLSSNRVVPNVSPRIETPSGGESFSKPKGSNPALVVYFYQNCLNQIFESAGMTSDQINAAHIALDGVLTPKQHFKMNQDLTLSNKAINNLVRMRKNIEQVIKKQVIVKAAITIQSHLRGWNLRRKLNSLSKEDRNSIRLAHVKIYQLILLERDYVSTFQQIIQQYCVPIRATSLKGLPDSLKEYLLNNLEQLLPLHESLLKLLEENMNEATPFTFNVGQLFLQTLSKMMPAYSKYVSNHQASIESLSYLEKNNPKFQSFLEEIRPGGSIKQLKEYLEWPLDHFSVLEKKLSGLRAYYLKTNKDFPILDQATEAYGAGGDFMGSLVKQNRIPTQQQTIKQLLSVEWQVESDRPLQLLNWSKRKLIKEGPVRFSGKKTTYHIHLCNDLLLVTERLVNGFKFVRLVSNHQITQIDDSKDKELIIRSHNEPDLELLFKGKTEKSEWATVFQGISEQLQKHRVYGLSLEALVRREGNASGVPSIMTRTLTWIRQHGQQTEGIFRVPGDSAQIANFQRMLDLGNEKEIDFRTCSLHDVAGLVKLYLRELPEPLIPFAFYPSLIEAQQSFDQLGPQYLDSYKRDITVVLNKIPEVNLKALRYLLEFLLDFSTHHQETKMDVANLAMVFAPNIVRPQVDTVDTAMESAYVSKVVETLIHDYKEYWDSITVDPKRGNNLKLDLMMDKLLLDTSGDDSEAISANLLKLSGLTPRASNYIDLSPGSRSTSSPDVAIRRQPSDVNVRPGIPSLDSSSPTKTPKRRKPSRINSRNLKNPFDSKNSPK